MDSTSAPLEYLAACSTMALESYELSRLNQASNLRKEFREVIEEWIQSEADARLARWILESKRAQPASANPSASLPDGPVPLPALLSSVAANDIAKTEARTGGLDSSQTAPSDGIVRASADTERLSWHLQPDSQQVFARNANTPCLPSVPHREQLAQNGNVALRQLELFAQSQRTNSPCRDGAEEEGPPLLGSIVYCESAACTEQQLARKHPRAAIEMKSKGTSRPPSQVLRDGSPSAGRLRWRPLRAVASQPLLGSAFGKRRLAPAP